MRHQIAAVRSNIQTLCSEAAGLDASRVILGMDDIDVGDDILQQLNSQVPTDIQLTQGSLATAYFASTPVFSLGELITIDCPQLEEMNPLNVGSHVITTVDVADKFICWNVPAFSDTFDITPAAGDLIFTTPMVTIRPAENTDTDGDTGIAQTTVEVLLHFGLAGDTDQDWLPIESLVFKLRDALADQENWADVCIGIKNLKIAKPKLLRKQKPFVGLYLLTLDFSGV